MCRVPSRRCRPGGGFRGGGVDDAGEQVGCPDEGGAADVLAAGRAGADAGQECRRVLPGGLADGLVDEIRDEFGQRLPVVGDGGAGRGQVRGEAGPAGRGVGFQAALGAVLGVLHGVEEGHRGVAALRREAAQQGFHLLEIGGVVVEGEAAVAPHRAEVLFIGQQADGARDLTPQDTAQGVVLDVCHFSPSAQSINAHSQ